MKSFIKYLNQKQKKQMIGSNKRKNKLIISDLYGYKIMRTLRQFH